MTTAKQSAGVTAAYAIVTCLFFAWGFITSLIDPLVAAVKGIFTLTDFQAPAAAFAFFIAYGVTSFPAAALLARLKSIPTILTALGMMIAGCLVMLVAANLAVFTLVLLGLFILASGITVLQVAANPLSAALGDPRYSHLRLTLSQTFNSLGTFIGPLLGAHLFLAGVEVKEGTAITEEVRANALAGIDSAYFWICGLIAALAVFFWLSRRVVTEAAPPSSAAARGRIGSLIADAFTSRWALFGGLAIFLYVGAEVAIGTQMALFLNADSVWGQSDAPFGVPLLGYAMGSDGVSGVSLQEAGKAVAFYWGGAMIGRAIGSVALGIGLFISIMFPVIFTLALERSSASEEATSGLLCTAIIGGAFLPLLVGLVSQHSSYVTAFIVPAVCYVVLCLFALAAATGKKVSTAAPAATIH